MTRASPRHVHASPRPPPPPPPPVPTRRLIDRDFGAASARFRDAARSRHSRAFGRHVLNHRRCETRAVIPRTIAIHRPRCVRHMCVCVCVLLLLLCCAVGDGGTAAVSSRGPRIAIAHARFAIRRCSDQRAGYAAPRMLTWDTEDSSRTSHVVSITSVSAAILRIPWCVAIRVVAVGREGGRAGLSRCVFSYSRKFTRPLVRIFGFPGSSPGRDLFRRPRATFFRRGGEISLALALSRSLIRGKS